MQNWHFAEQGPTLLWWIHCSHLYSDCTHNSAEDFLASSDEWSQIHSTTEDSVLLDGTWKSHNPYIINDYAQTQ